MTKLGKLNGIEIKFEKIPTVKVNYVKIGWPSGSMLNVVGIKEYEYFNFKIDVKNYDCIYNIYDFVLETNSIKGFITGCVTSFSSNGKCQMRVCNMIINFLEGSKFNLKNFL